MDIFTNISLAPFTTFGIGGPARWYAKATSEADLAEAVSWAGERGAALFVLGGGSNLLVSDAGFNGLVLHVAVNGIQQEGGRFQCGAGEEWDAFVSLAIHRGFAGVECLAGIPGTVGGTPVQNVGAYGQEVSSVIERVRAFDQVDRRFVELPNAECGFAYRLSRFNSTDRGRFIVSRVDYRLSAGGAPQLSYADVKLHFQQRTEPPSLREVADAVRSIRQSKGMLITEGDPDCHSAGSFFKNPTVPQEVANGIRQMADALKAPLRVFPAANGQVKVPAAWLIEQAGFPRGYVAGNAGISSRHTLALINRSGASANEILALAKRISEAVQSKFKVRLEIEPVLLGFENA